jgi:hypothetical protein
MTRPFDADRVLEDWLAEGPSRLPDRVIDGIVRQLDEHQQRKHVWLPGRDRMNRLYLTVGGAAATVLLAAVGVAFFFAGGMAPVPGVTPSPEPTAVSEPVLFTSERHGYTVELPDDTWTVLEIPGQWPPGTVWESDTEGADHWMQEADQPPGSRDRLFLNSQALSGTTPFGEWFDQYQALRAQAFGPCLADDSPELATVNGLSVHFCGYRLQGPEQLYLQAVWEQGGRAYVLTIAQRADSEIQIDLRAEIEVWLERLDFAER